MQDRIDIDAGVTAYRQSLRLQEVWNLQRHTVQTTLLWDNEGFRGKWYIAPAENETVLTGDAPLVYDDMDTARLETLKAALVAIEHLS